MNLNKDPESWARVKPDAFLTGSIVQARNVIEMAVQDIAKLAAFNAELLDAIEATEKLDARQCEECDGEGEPESCGLCFPAADDARLKRRAALERGGREQP